MARGARRDEARAAVCQSRRKSTSRHYQEAKKLHQSKDRTLLRRSRRLLSKMPRAMLEFLPFEILRQIILELISPKLIDLLTPKNAERPHTKLHKETFTSSYIRDHFRDLHDLLQVPNRRLHTQLKAILYTSLKYEIRSASSFMFETLYQMHQRQLKVLKAIGGKIGWLLFPVYVNKETDLVDNKGRSGYEKLRNWKYSADRSLTNKPAHMQWKEFSALDSLQRYKVFLSKVVKSLTRDRHKKVLCLELDLWVSLEITGEEFPHGTEAALRDLLEPLKELEGLVEVFKVVAGNEHASEVFGLKWSRVG